MVITENVKEIGCWDVVVVGGGVAGVAAAVAAARQGKKTLIIEKSLNFGGLATIGIVNYFVPMCNGRGTQICYGMADEMLKLSYKYGWTSMRDCWINDYPEKQGRMDGKFSPAIFSLALLDYMKEAGVEIFIDTVFSTVVVKDGHVEGIVIESKSGREFVRGRFFVDVTGDADLMYRAGMPTVDGGNYFTYYAQGMNFETMQKALDSGKIHAAYRWYMGGRANLYGGNHPEGKKYYVGTTREDVTEYITDNQMILLDTLKGLDRDTFDLTYLPHMPQFRTTRRLDGDKTFSHYDAYKHCEDSICAINDFDRKDYLYEVPYGTLVKTGFDNVITAGRTASARGYGWDVLRVIPPAILTGQAAGNACAQALDDGVAIYDVDVSKLQKTLISQNVIIHFDDALIPEDVNKEEKGEDNGHI